MLCSRCRNTKPAWKTIFMEQRSNELPNLSTMPEDDPFVKRSQHTNIPIVISPADLIARALYLNSSSFSSSCIRKIITRFQYPSISIAKLYNIEICGEAQTTATNFLTYEVGSLERLHFRLYYKNQSKVNFLRQPSSSVYRYDQKIVIWQHRVHVGYLNDIPREESGRIQKYQWWQRGTVSQNVSNIALKR